MPGATIVLARLRCTITGYHHHHHPHQSTIIIIISIIKTIHTSSSSLPSSSSSSFTSSSSPLKKSSSCLLLLLLLFLFRYRHHYRVLYSSFWIVPLIIIPSVNCRGRRQNATASAYTTEDGFPSLLSVGLLVKLRVC